MRFLGGFLLSQLLPNLKVHCFALQVSPENRIGYGMKEDTCMPISGLRSSTSRRIHTSPSASECEEVYPHEKNLWLKRQPGSPNSSPPHPGERRSHREAPRPVQSQVGAHARPPPRAPPRLERSACKRGGYFLPCGLRDAYMCLLCHALYKLNPRRASEEKQKEADRKRREREKKKRDSIERCEIHLFPSIAPCPS